MRNYHVMAHPKKPELGFVHVALNQWAKYRQSGFEFVPQADVDAAELEASQAEQAQKDLETVEPEATVDADEQAQKDLEALAEKKDKAKK